MGLCLRWKLKIERIWAMPNKETFTIKPISNLLSLYLVGEDGRLWVDPFAGKNSPAILRNDLNPCVEPVEFHKDALEFLKGFWANSVYGVLFDPPYSVTQVKTCYDGIGVALTQEDTTPLFWTRIKRQIAKIMEVGGICISFGWNSGGIGKVLGFSIEEILLVPHGGIHNDTIVVVERKL